MTYRCHTRFLSALFLVNASLFAWEHHYLLTYEILDAVPEIAPDKMVKAETLEAFINAERIGLAKVLDNIETWSKTNLLSYAPLPSYLMFKGVHASHGLTLMQQFLLSIRVNPDIGYPLFTLSPWMATKTKAHEANLQFSAEEKMALPLKTLARLQDKHALRKIAPGESVSIRTVLASGSEEPDHGLDMGLWLDNGTWFGALYGFGPQPFGNPKLEYGSQAPFHMGFFHEDKLLYFFGDFIKRCYPLYRIKQFTELARFAFATGHDYWGYRFLGLALHYLQDLTQPYHARIVPGVTTTKLIFINLLSQLGYRSPVNERTILMSNRHMGLENYQLHHVLESVMRPSGNDLNAALRQSAKETSYVTYSETYARDVVAREAFAQADMLDNLMATVFSARLMSDPSFDFPSDLNAINLAQEATLNQYGDGAKLKSLFLEMMSAVGAHSRIMIRSELTRAHP